MRACCQGQPNVDCGCCSCCGCCAGSTTETTCCACCASEGADCTCPGCKGCGADGVACCGQCDATATTDAEDATEPDEPTGEAEVEVNVEVEVNASRDQERARFKRLVADVASRIDRAKPTGTTPEGRRYWHIRTRFPVQFPGAVVHRRKDAAVVVDDSAPLTRDATVTVSTGTTAVVDPTKPAGPCVVEGVASSTSRDFYGTEMTEPCLQKMRSAFAAGVPLVPTHGGFFSAPEWDSVLGMSIGALVERANVSAGQASEQGYVCTVQTQLYDVDGARQLMSRLAAGQMIGQSIGGWFVDVQYVEGDTPEEDRIFVNEVELDHLAVTRAPANPDCMGIVMLRSALGARVRLAVEQSIGHNRAAALRSLVAEESAAVATPAVTEPTTPEAPVEEVIEVVPIDETRGAGHSGDEQVDAGGAPQSSVQPDVADNQERAMPIDDSKLDTILSELRGLSGRVGAIEQRTATVATSAAVAEPTIEERLRVAEQRAVVAEEIARRAISTPQRHGIAYGPEAAPLVRSAFERIMQRAKVGENCHPTPTLVDVLARNIDLVTKPALDVCRNRPESMKLDTVFANAESMLRDALMAAEYDGLLKNPFDAAGATWAD